MKIFVHTRTIFKAEHSPANELPTHKKIEVPAGASFVATFEVHHRPWINDHHHVVLTSNLGSGEQNRRQFWYVPKVHVDIFECVARVTTDGLNFRTSPNPTDPNNIIKKLSLGTFIDIGDAAYVNETLGIWWCGRPVCTADQRHWFDDPQLGWMSSKHLEMTDKKFLMDGRGPSLI